MQLFGQTFRISFFSLLTGLVLLSGCGEQKQESALPPPPKVSVMEVQSRPVLLSAILPGRTSAYRMAEIRPQVNGLILKRLFVEGADVKEGDVLYQIDPAPFQAALDNARAALERSAATLPSVRLRAERYKSLLAEKAVSRQDYDDAASALKQAEADIIYWRAMVETALINLNYTRVTAPISGRIGRSTVTEGAIVTAYQAQAMATIQQLDPIYVDVPQSTTDLFHMSRSVADGHLDNTGERFQVVSLIMEDESVYPHQGQLQFRDVSVDATTGSVTLRIVVPNPDHVLMPGLFVRAEIKEGINTNAILISQQAVYRDLKGNPLAMVIKSDNTAEQRTLVIDRPIGDEWLVSKGLSVGENLVVEGVQRVKPGMTVNAVRVTSPDAATSPETGHRTPDAQKTDAPDSGKPFDSAVSDPKPDSSDAGETTDDQKPADGPASEPVPDPESGLISDSMSDGSGNGGV
ncbi:efflux RND transporter periplasmic adaptor subunit [Desulfosarcina sp. OttesenSCG-928-G17]|nr:efflux RND transporter periplasmic adaptor subunit [Desulfosarcina sp. OttesenSCG-928-G17]